MTPSRRCCSTWTAPLVDTNYLHATTWWEALTRAGHDVPMARIHRAIGQGSDQLLDTLLPADRDKAADDDIRTAHAALYSVYWSRQPALTAAGAATRREMVMGLWGKRDDMIVHQADPYNAEPPRGALAGRMLTPLDSFYGRNHGPIPLIDPRAWRLSVGGLTERNLDLSLDDLRDQFAERTVTATLQCAGNRRAGLMEVRDIPGEAPWGPGATSTARWTGVSLAEVLRAAGPGEEASYVAFDAPDVSEIADPPQPYGSSVPLAKALAGEVLLAWAMNGQPLPPVHGAPVRVMVPGYIGARSVKWVERITLQDHPSDNYFQAVAYRLLPAEADPAAAMPGEGLSLGAVALNADILRPDDGAVLTAGAAGVTGYAFAGGGRGIARVDVSVDGAGRWQQADLGEDAGPWAWRHWRTVIRIPAGPTEIIVRAWDTSAAAQPESARQLWNPKGYVNNSWTRLHVTAG